MIGWVLQIFQNIILERFIGAILNANGACLLETTTQEAARRKMTLSVNQYTTSCLELLLKVPWTRLHKWNVVTLPTCKAFPVRHVKLN